ncbi:MAG TPA: undecaprenyl-phosphate glucose phosphotransferase [Sphingomonas sp.]|jgi:Undecaprenyl-phosphate glucose phosphotransferase|nr:undecaprenyl-phosphate glucose phosphotransferase [Sphingomonas sp.]
MKAAPGEIQERRAKRTPVMLELSGFFSRVGEWLVVSIVGLIGIWVMADVFILDPVEQYVRVAWLSGVAYALIAELTGCYDLDARFTLRTAWTRVITAWIGCGVAMLTIAFFMKTSGSFSRGWTVAWFLSVASALILTRGMTTLMMRSMKRSGVFNQRVAIFGSGAQSDRLARYISSNAALTIDLVGCYDDHGDRSGAGDDRCVPFRGGLPMLLADIRGGRVDQVIVAMPLPDGVDIEEVVGKLSMLPVLIRLAPDLSEFALAGRSMVMLGEIPLMTLFERPINGVNQITKRIEDLVLGTLLLILFAPLFAVVALAIKLDSPGTVFFRQDREGFNHETFRIWKFRSMRNDALQFDNIKQATAGDRRVTRIGRFLRGSSIDELPQLINVVAGQMSLVGPRPHAPSTKVAGILFSEATQNYAARHRVKPGMTGWAQVNGWRGETDTDEKLLKRVECDLFYIEHWSIGFDLYIIIRTFAAVLFPKSAY